MMAILDWLDGILYYPILVIVLVASGLYFSYRTKFVQFRLFGESVRILKDKPEEKGAMSSLKALMISTASRVGTGNIVGVSTAICLGGFGSVFWMWVIALVGMGTAFIESTLAQIYKRRDHNGDSYGGPAYYIQDALNSRIIGCIFAIFLILTYAGGFNMLASYNLQDSFRVFGFYHAGVTPWIIGGVIALLVLWCIMGGGKRIGDAAGTLVPIMSVLYILVALTVVIAHINLLPGVIAEIFRNAFDFKAIFSGIAGSCMMYGIKRGLFSNEAGVGSAPNAAAAASVSHPVKQGLVQMFSVFLDTIIICTATAFMCMCSGVAISADVAGATMVHLAAGTVLGNSLSAVFVTASMSLFAFTTLIGNFFYVNNCLAFLNKGKMPSRFFMIVFRIVAALVIFVGAGLSMAAAWDIADIMMALMCLVNIPACVLLGNVAIKACENYAKQKKEGKNPVFRAADIGMDASKLDYWQ